MRFFGRAFSSSMPLLDLGEQLHELAPALFLGALLRVALVAHRLGRRQQRELALHLNQQLGLGVVQLLDLLARILVGIAGLDQRRRRQRRLRAALLDLAAAARLAWAIACGFSGASPERN
jgi:hypothetical protein